MKFLLVPENNSLSHVAKCLAIEDGLTSQGHDVLLAVSRKSASFLRGVGRSCAVIPDLQENDGAAFPTVQWFSNPGKIAECIAAEVALIKEYRPDRVLGVFRFTVKAAAALCGIPYDSLSCGCLLPSHGEVLGFAPGEEGGDLQGEYLDLFFRYAGDRVSGVLKRLGLAGITDVREMLQGERTFLWDFPEFAPIPHAPGVHHVGPIAWHSWPHDEGKGTGLFDSARPLAVVSFGTCINSTDAAARLVRLLAELGYQVVLAAGGQSELIESAANHPRVTICRFAPLHLLFPHAKLLVCHGGQMTVFEALAHRVPVLVLPLQPEQAHNGVCLERLGTGRRLLRPQIFRGAPRVYTEAFEAMSDDHCCALLSEFTRGIDTSKLREAQRSLGRYDAVQTLCSHLVN